MVGVKRVADATKALVLAHYDHMEVQSGRT